MRNLFFIAIALFGGVGSALAQDTIVLKNNSEISAIVQEVGIDNVKYKKFENPNGPNYVLLQSDILMIKYENGTQDIFDQKTKIEANWSPELEQMRKEFYLIGIDDVKMLEFFKNHDTKFYTDFQSACKQRQKGTSLLAGGIILSMGGVVTGIIGGIQHNTPTYVVGILVGTLGEGLTIGGIVHSAVAGGKKRAIKNDFSKAYFGEKEYSYQPSLNFGLTTNGIGFVINF